MGWLRASIVFGVMTLAGCSGTKGGEPADAGRPDGGLAFEFKMRAAPATGNTTITVLDRVTAAPLVGARVQLSGGAPLLTNQLGQATFSAPVGRTPLEVTNNGFLSFSREVVVSSSPSTIVVRLVVRGAPVIIGGAGGSVPAGAASLVFPAGALDAGTAVSATFIGSTQIGSIPGPIQFLSDAGTHHRALGMLSVEIARQPALPVEVRLPVKQNAQAARLSLFDLSSGERFATTSAAGGIASFSLPHFSDYVLTTDTDFGNLPSSSQDYGFTVTSVSGSADLVTPQPGGEPMVQPVAEGDLVPNGSSIRSTTDVAVGLVAPSGAEVHTTGKQDVTYHSSPSPSSPEPESVRIDRLYNFYFRSQTPARWWSGRDANRPRFKARTRAAVLGVRGTVFSYGQRSCVEQPGPWVCLDAGCFPRQLVFVDVNEGTVDVEANGTTSALNAGAALEACTGCKPNQQFACCDESTCKGCCSASDSCEPGVTSDACGLSGGACETCAMGDSCQQATSTCGPFFCTVTSSNLNPNGSCSGAATCSDGRLLGISCGVPDPIDARSDCTCTTTLGTVTQMKSGRVVEDCRSEEFRIHCP